MAESSTKKKEDSLEDSLSSEEWTIIDQKESKVDNTSDEENENKTSNVPKETVITEDACENEESKSEVEHVEECEESGEKDVESDDVSILSDESESEQLVVEEGRIEKIECQVERQSNESRALTGCVSLGEGSSSWTLISSTCLICSLIVVTLTIVIVGRVAHFQGHAANYAVRVEIAEKLKELAAIEDKLKELIDVKEALAQIGLSMTDVTKLGDQLKYQKYEEMKPRTSFEKYINSNPNFNKQKIFNSNIQNDRLETLETIYRNFCLIMNAVFSPNSDVENDFCKTPKVLSDMVTYKKNLKRAIESLQEEAMSEKRIFFDHERKLDLISGSLLSEFSTMFTKFSFKMQERLNEFENKLHPLLCLLKNFKKSDDKFLNILFVDDFFINNCNATEDLITSTSDSKKTRYREMKKKNNYERYKAYKKFEDSMEDYANTNEGDSYDDIVSLKSKGEITYDNWKKNNHEKEKYYHGENKFDRNEKFEQNNKNDFRHKRESESEFGKLFEKIERVEGDDYKIYYKNTKRDYKSGRKHDYKKDDYYGGHEYERRRYYDSQLYPYYSGEYHELDQKFEGKRDDDYGNHYESKRNNKDGKKKNDRRYDDTNDDSKFSIKMDNGAEDKVKNKYQERQKYKNKEYVLKPENFKESKYAKYDNHERRDRKDKYPTGEWQMQRGKAREKQRNSDWYFVRADSRQKARIIDEDETQQEETVWRSSPRANKKNRGDNLHSPDKPDSFRGRLMRKIGRTWDFLNKEIRNYF